MSVLRRTLGEGEAAIEVSAQGFGCMGMTANVRGRGLSLTHALTGPSSSPSLTPPCLYVCQYGDPMADADAIELIDAVYKAGVTFCEPSLRSADTAAAAAADIRRHRRCLSDDFRPS